MFADGCIPIIMAPYHSIFALRDNLNREQKPLTICPSSRSKHDPLIKAAWPITGVIPQYNIDGNKTMMVIDKIFLAIEDVYWPHSRK